MTRDSALHWIVDVLNDLRRAYIHRHPSPAEDVLPSMRYAIVCPDGTRKHAASWDEAVAVFDDAVRRECERKGGQSCSA